MYQLFVDDLFEIDDLQTFTRIELKTYASREKKPSISKHSTTGILSAINQKPYIFKYKKSSNKIKSTL